MDFLLRLYKTNSYSGNTKAITRVIVDELKKIKGVRITEHKGNIYATKGISDTYPCVVAHTDQVQKWDRIMVNCYNMPEGLMIKGFDPETWEPRGIGGDDKNGVWIALRMMIELPYCKVAFFRDEEIGCVGSSLAKMDFFDNCRFVIQCDRRGNSDFITEAGGTQLCDNNFAALCGKYGYNIAYGAMTDVMQLKDNGLKIAACNMSCGYHQPHSDDEYTIVEDLIRCKELVYDMCTTFTEVIPHEYVKPVRNYNWNSYDYYWGDYNDYNISRYYAKRKYIPKRGKRW